MTPRTSNTIRKK